MDGLKILIAEDNANDLEACMDSANIFQRETGRPIHLVACRTLDDALETINSTFDGAIIDLNFAEKGGEGNQILKKIRERYFRLPVAIFTATPASADREFNTIGVFKKGETFYSDIIKAFSEIYDTGLTRIMGGRGIIERTLNEVFEKNLIPHLDKWKEYGTSEPSGTEKALLRYTLNHLLQLLDDDGDKCFPEEVYINTFPPYSEKLKTGRIIKKKVTEDYYVILNPACDLVLRKDGQAKTDQLLLVKIDDQQAYIKENLKEVKKAKKEERLKKIFSNGETLYHHWLPQKNLFPGGFVNFRIVFTLRKDDFENEYKKTPLQISPHFVKDILSRFSSYYARQGQPEIKNDEIITQIISSMEN